jgi:hypothetical protein
MCLSWSVLFTKQAQAHQYSAPACLPSSRAGAHREGVADVESLPLNVLALVEDLLCGAELWRLSFIALLLAKSGR